MDKTTPDRPPVEQRSIVPAVLTVLRVVELTPADMRADVAAIWAKCVVTLSRALAPLISQPHNSAKSVRTGSGPLRCMTCCLHPIVPHCSILSICSFRPAAALARVLLPKMTPKDLKSD